MTTGTGRPTVHLIASLGGHLELLDTVAPALDGFDRVWITSEGSRAESLRTRGEAVRTLPRLDRSSATAGALLAGVRLAAAERPRLVLTSGAGLALPFTLASRALGARVMWLETMARVTSGSLTGRIVSRVADQVIVQWPELRRQYPRALVCRPTLLEGVERLGGASGEGTFVTVGSHDAAFDRLLRAVEAAAEAGVLPQPVTVQTGCGAAASGAIRAVDYMSPEDFGAAVRGARVVVCHGGAGAIATVLRAGKRPLVMPRRQRLGEHVDDHQLDLVAKLSDLGLAVTVDGPIAPGDVQLSVEPQEVSPRLASAPSVRSTLAAVVAASQTSY